MDCVLCGARNANRKAMIEGVTLTVCNQCVKMGEEVKEVKMKLKTVRPTELPEEMDQYLVKDFSKILRRQREKRGLTQEKLGEKLNIRASLIRRIEDGWEPPFPIVHRLEKFFRIKLIEKLEDRKIVRKQFRGSGVTIGDIMEIE